MKRSNLDVNTLKALLPGKKWNQLKLGFLLVLLMVVGVVIFNLETVFPQYSYDESHLKRIPNVQSDMNWPASTYLNQERPVHRTNDKVQPMLPGMLVGEEIFVCDRSHDRTDLCFMKGDVRMYSNSTSFVLHAVNETTVTGEEKLKPYTRKWEKSCMELVHEVTLKSTRKSAEIKAGECDVRHSVPAVVFSTGGYTGNVYHEFHDGLIPLYITSQHLKGEVVFVIVEYHNWWLTKYEDVVKQLTKYEVIDFEKDGRVHCFPEVTVGLHIHDEMAIDETLMPNGESIRDFRDLIDRAYSTDRRRPPAAELKVTEKPRLVIIVRNGTRVILNLEEIIKLAERVGFQVNLCQPDPTTELKKIYWTLNSSEVMIGVHGAAMTHFLFMRPGTVFIQIIPLGTEWAAAAYYGKPAVKLGLEYIGYSVEAKESSLSDKYDEDDVVLKDPAAVIEKKWSVLKQIYLEGQDVRPSLSRFNETLFLAKAKASSFMRHTLSPHLNNYTHS